MRRLSPLLCPGSLFCLLLSVYGCELALTPILIEREKNTIDLIGQAPAPVEYAWEGAIKATEDVDIAVDAQDFDGTEGLIRGHVGALEFIRIYISRVTPKSTRIGIQARTSSYPLSRSGYDRDFAQTMMEQIQRNVRIAYYASAESAESVREERPSQEP